jgi:hypothetical protein
MGSLRETRDVKQGKDRSRTFLIVIGCQCVAPTGSNLLIGLSQSVVDSFTVVARLKKSQGQIKRKAMEAMRWRWIINEQNTYGAIRRCQ